MTVLGSLTKLSMSAPMLKQVLKMYPPLFGAGIRATKLSKDFRYAKITMPLTWYNRNYVGSHYGGSLYSMTDPWYMLMLLNILGNDFVVWDQAASIKYVAPGKSCVTAEFQLEDSLVQSLQEMDLEEKRVFELPVDVTDVSGNIVAQVTKTLYVKRKGMPTTQKLSKL